MWIGKQSLDEGAASCSSSALERHILNRKKNKNVSLHAFLACLKQLNGSPMNVIVVYFGQTLLSRTLFPSVLPDCLFHFLQDDLEQHHTGLAFTLVWVR